MSRFSTLPKEDRKMLNSIFLRSFAVFAGGAGQVKAGATGFMNSLMPAFKRFYGDNLDKMKDALTRHSGWYNITQNVGTFAMGLVAAMERENSQKPDFDTSSIVALKTSLMGPMSGIGDAIFWGIVRVIAAGVAISMAGNGSLLAPVMFLVLYNLPSVVTRWYMTYLGYTLGSNFVESMYKTGRMRILTKAASTLGLLMIGGMTASMVTFTTKLSITIQGGQPILIQTYLDSLFKGLVPLGIALSSFYLLNKKVNFAVIIFGFMILGIVLALIGVV